MADSTSAASKSWDPKQYQEAIGPAVLAGEPIEIQRLLGSGGEGAAFLCVGRQGQIADQPFVVKIPSDLRDDPSFGLEADLFKDSLKRHCVIPRGPDSLRLKNNAHMHALVMPFCNGGDLKMRMKQRSAAAEPYSFGEAASIMSQTAIGLRESGLVHRDVKPANILFHNEQAMVADWGLAVRPGDRNDPSGTAGYLAPESIRHKFPAHEHQDVYAIGLIGYELVTRRPARPLPPDLVNRLDINKFIDQDDRIRATKKNPLFDQILLHATTRDPDKRSSHLDMLADLAHYPEARRHFNDQDRQAIAAHLIERAAQRPDRSPELDRAAAAGLLEMGPWQERDQRALEAVA